MATLQLVNKGTIAQILELDRRTTRPVALEEALITPKVVAGRDCEADIIYDVAGLCSEKAELGRHGWLCQRHRLYEDRRHVMMPPPEADADRIVRTDREIIKRTRPPFLGSRGHLMRASVYLASGERKFPW